MCALSKRRRPTTCGSNQGLHSSSAGMRIGRATSLKAPVAHQPRPRRSDVVRASANGAANGSNNVPMSARITPALHTLPMSDMGCHYRLWLAHNGQTCHDSIIRSLHTSICRHWTWPCRIVRGVHTSISRRRTRPASVVHSPHTSVYQRQTWPGLIVLGLHNFVCRRRTWATTIVRGLHTSVSRLRRIPPKIARDPTHIACRTRAAAFRKLFTFVSRRRTWPANIVRSLHTSIGLPTSDVVCLYHLLLALVKRATSHAETLVENVRIWVKRCIFIEVRIRATEIRAQSGPRIERGVRASSNDRRHWPWPARINAGAARSAGRHRRGLHATPCDARQKLEASAKACTHLTSHVRIGQTTSAKGSGISRGLHSSTVACEHRLGDIGVGQWHAASNKAWTHLMWHVRIWQALSANGRQQQPRPAHI
ncbi:hypothetical protein H5410_014717 [Solanum commersonii]|uniref:Uncharacterized protein n=1 Tax=Solanum commersonii TaxID=4109 RepID=A0A9J5ZRM8_SOLCO|nr:hypothetical protein H5410_014717 [Solanum commersonii]